MQYPKELDPTSPPSLELVALELEPVGLELEPVGLELEPVGLELEPVGLPAGMEVEVGREVELVGPLSAVGMEAGPSAPPTVVEHVEPAGAVGMEAPCAPPTESVRPFFLLVILFFSSSSFLILSCGNVEDFITSGKTMACLGKRRRENIA